MRKTSSQRCDIRDMHDLQTSYTAAFVQKHITSGRKLFPTAGPAPACGGRKGESGS